jgi:hypothetical protein
VIRRNYEKQRPVPPDKPAAHKRRPPRHAREYEARPVSRDSLTREEPEAHVADLEHNISDRDRTIIDQNEQLEAQRRRIAELENDRAWLKSEVRQYKSIVASVFGASAADARVFDVSDGFEVSDPRESREIIPPVQFGRPHYAGWARLMAQAIANAETVAEVEWLRDDNREHIAALEAETPGAGKGIEDRLNRRVLELE